ncbi:hypothetical protein PGTUg99_011143 [Puccinia graminis f. sp. tritici]|nr:hypothetical protein PGTUg99_006337 [Puccinia graminis f. sp. tritici]KAA1128113.1 hypothetical protein PGTUg99_011143 [Puccinia graminis f. sp. tritici]
MRWLKCLESVSFLILIACSVLSPPCQTINCIHPEAHIHWDVEDRQCTEQYTCEWQGQHGRCSKQRKAIVEKCLCGDELGHQWATDECPNHPHFIKNCLQHCPS